MPTKFRYHTNGTLPSKEDTLKWVFVFGSNKAGRHGAGAALEAATNYGAVMGYGIGRSPKNAPSYGIPTKNEQIKTLDLSHIKPYIDNFISYAKHRQLADEHFWMTAIGCGLAGYTHRDIAPMFRAADPHNISFPIDWAPYLEPDQKIGLEALEQTKIIPVHIDASKDPTQIDQTQSMRLML